MYVFYLKRAAFMMMYNKVNITPDEDKFISDFVLSDSFKWYKQGFQTDFTPPPEIADRVANTFFFSHALSLRKNLDIDKSGKINSEYYDFFYEIFLRWLKENNYTTPKTVFRSSINLTGYHNKEFSVPHYDHEWPHWNWIMYLNEVEASTLLFDEKYNIIHEFKANKYHACAFENTLHAHQFCKINETRCVVVFTFDQ